MTALEPVELFVRDRGSGPPILLLHGLGADHTLWNEVVPLLEGDFRALVPDLRGHGRSPAPASATYALEEFDADLLRLADERWPDGAHIVGLSAGAFLGLRLARSHPGRVRSLTLINGAAYCDPHTKEVIQSWQEAFRDGGADGLALRLMKDLFDRDWMEAHLEIAELLRRDWTDARLGVVARWASAITRFDMRGQLARIATPTLILQGMSDVVIDPSHGRFLRQSIPGAELRLYRETGHLMPIERPAETAAALREFLGKVESSRPPAPA